MPAKIITYTSPAGIKEQAITSARIPGGNYKSRDTKKEKRLSAINFYDSQIALCPKIWSTSPATMVRDISVINTDHNNYERHHCIGKNTAPGVKKLAKFKQTMNQHDTSGTFSTSSLLYYHFSRYFDTTITIPAAVYREMDRNEHYQRVTRSGQLKTRRGMINAGWDQLAKAEKNPTGYKPTNELFTPDRSKIYGVLLDGKGTRYKAEINGIRSRWGRRQNEDFQRTAPFMALRSKEPLLTAIKEGKHRAFKDVNIRSATRGVSDFQMLYWMREITEIVLLDYIFSQQDRIGNIDYCWAWYWVQDGKVKKQGQPGKFLRKQMSQFPPPAAIAQYSPQLIQRTYLNDNDAGGRVPYANFTKKTQMLEKLRHLSAKTYTRLIRLNRDLQDKGAVYRYIEQNFVLDADQHNQIVKNTRLATQILSSSCQNGELRFDLDNPKDFLIHGQVQEKNLNGLLL